MNKKFVCLTCGNTKVGEGHDPTPIRKGKVGLNRRVCDDCHWLYVIPAQQLKWVNVTLYDEQGRDTGLVWGQTPPKLDVRFLWEDLHLPTDY